MPGKKQSPKNTQPKKKKQRVKSKTDIPSDVNKGHSANAVGGVFKSDSVNTNLCVTPGTYSMASAMQAQQVQYPPPPPQQMSQPMSFQNSMQSPLQTSTQPHMMPFSYSPSQQPNPQFNVNFKPDWATEILDNMKEMKKELSKLSSIEKTLGTLTYKINQMENKVSTMETVVNNCEKSCGFLSTTYDTQSNDLKAAKDNIKTLKKQCDSFETQVTEQNKTKAKLESKITDLEARSMRENLLFHGIPETQNEDCEMKVKEFLINELGLESDSVNTITLDRVHRIGRGTKGSTRPIVAKFHKYTDREKVREAGYAKRIDLQTRNLAVKPQLPYDVVQKRKGLNTVYEKAKKEGKKPKFVMDKLFIDGIEYVTPTPSN